MPNAGREDAMIAAVFRTGDVFFGNGKIVSSQLPKQNS